MALQMAAKKAWRNIQANIGKFGMVEQERSTPQGDTVHTVRRFQEDKEEQDDLEDYFVKEEEELLEGVTMTKDTSR